MHRRGIGLLCGHQGVADLMIGDNLLFFGRNDCTLALVPGDDHLHRFLQVLLDDPVPPALDRAQGRLIDNVGKLGAGRAGGSAGDGGIIDMVVRLDVFGVHLKDGFPSRQVRQFHRDAAVKPARAQKRLVQRFRAVGGGQNNDPLLAVKAVHFGEQLV